MNITVKTNAKEWKAAMKAWMKATGKSHDDCVNKFAYESCVKAISFTPKAKVGKINTFNPEKGGKTKKQKLLFALASKKGIRKGSGGEQIMYPYVKKEFNKRKRSVGAIKAGFIKPAIELGARLKARPFAGGSASRSRGVKSKRYKMLALSINVVDGAGKIGDKPMLRAMSFAIQREHNWAIKRLQKRNNKFSAKAF